MARESIIHSLKKTYRGHIPKGLSISKAWHALRPNVIEHITGHESGYVTIPYLMDTKAYKNGYIFVSNATDVHCFCVAPQLKILGPICDFLDTQRSSSRWLQEEIPVIKSTPDETHYRVILGNGKNFIKFRIYDCVLLDNAPDMKIVGEVVIDRSTHEDLARADWFGLISGTLVANESDVTIKRDQSERVFSIGIKGHTVLFKYVICKMDKDGVVYEATTDELDCKWMQVQEDKDMDKLPLTEFVSQSTRVKS